jgi:hypothetical protein
VRALLAVALLAIGCAASPTAPDAIFRPVASGPFSAATSRGVRVVLDAPSWTQLLTQLVPSATPAPVDFGGEVVLLAFAGDRPSAGYRVSIERVVLRDRRFEMTIVEETPHPSCVVATVVTRPFAAVAVSRSDRAAEGIWTSRVGPPCS